MRLIPVLDSESKITAPETGFEITCYGCGKTLETRAPIRYRYICTECERQDNEEHPYI